MQNIFDIEQGVPEIRGFKWLEMILLRETKKREKIPLLCPSGLTFFASQKCKQTAHNKMYVSGPQWYFFLFFVSRSRIISDHLNPHISGTLCSISNFFCMTYP